MTNREKTMKNDYFVAVRMFGGAVSVTARSRSRNPHFVHDVTRNTVVNTQNPFYNPDNHTERELIVVAGGLNKRQAQRVKDAYLGAMVLNGFSKGKVKGECDE
jgi:uncharacterized secreted protein with C-terminal beta-propeller domain